MQVLVVSGFGGGACCQKRSSSVLFSAFAFAPGNQGKESTGS